MTERSCIFVPYLNRKAMTKGEATKQFIIERSAPIFNVKGIAATSMSDIMDATKLSKGSLYVHFENKDILANAAVDYNLKLLGDRVHASLDKHKAASDKLIAYFDTFKEPTISVVEGGCPMINFGMEADDTNPIVKNKVVQIVNVSQKIIAQIIEKGINDGEFKPDWNYKEFATVAFAMIEGGIIICRVTDNNQKMHIINDYLKKIIRDNTL